MTAFRQRAIKIQQQSASLRGNDTTAVVQHTPSLSSKLNKQTKILPSSLLTVNTFWPTAKSNLNQNKQQHQQQQSSQMISKLETRRTSIVNQQTSCLADIIWCPSYLQQCTPASPIPWCAREKWMQVSWSTLQKKTLKNPILHTWSFITKTSTVSLFRASSDRGPRARSASLPNSCSDQLLSSSWSD